MIILNAATILAGSATTLMSAYRAVCAVQAAHSCWKLANTALRTKGVVGNIFITLSLLVAGYSAARITYLVVKQAWTRKQLSPSELAEGTKKGYVLIGMGIAVTINYFAFFDGMNLPSGWD